MSEDGVNVDRGRRLVRSDDEVLNDVRRGGYAHLLTEEGFSVMAELVGDSGELEGRVGIVECP
jgi:hypothetical protein